MTHFEGRAARAQRLSRRASDSGVMNHAGRNWSEHRLAATGSRDSNCYTTVTFGVAGYSEAFYFPINGICEAIALLFTVLSASEGLRKNFFLAFSVLRIAKIRC